MSRFKKAVKKKELASALDKHPLKALDEAVKQDYVKGLVFIALEDENFSDDEKSYVKALIQNIGLEEAFMDEAVAFANDADEDAILEFMDRLKAFDADLKLNFMIEVVVISFKDGEFDESEQEMFNDYIEMLELEEQKDDIMYLAMALVNKDIDLALAFYTAKKDMFMKYDYMFDMIDVDIEKELKTLYTWEWIEWRFESGNVEDNNLVASKPVTVRQFCIFLNSSIINDEIVNIPNSTSFESKETKELIIADIEKANVVFENGLFIYEDSEKDNDFLGAKLNSIKFFTNYVNDKINITTKGLRIIANSYIIDLEESTKGFLSSNEEHFVANISYNNVGNVDRRFDTKQVDYHAYAKVQNKSYAFRVMKLEDSEV